MDRGLLFKVTFGLGHVRSPTVTGPHFLVFISQREFCKLIGEPSNTNFEVYFDRTWTEPMIVIWTWQIMLFEIQAMKVDILSLDGVNIARSYLSHHIISNDSSTSQN